MKQKNISKKNLLNVGSLYEKYIYKEDLKSESWSVRLSAYRELGFTKDAFKDTDWDIRLEAYLNLGWTKDALNDEYWEIRVDAEEYFQKVFIKGWKSL